MTEDHAFCGAGALYRFAALLTGGSFSFCSHPFELQKPVCSLPCMQPFPRLKTIRALRFPARDEHQSPALKMPVFGKADCPIAQVLC